MELILFNLMLSVLVDQEAIQSKLMSTLLEQSPIIIVLLVISYIMYGYILRQDKAIAAKDKIILQQTDKLMVLYGNAVESQNKLTHVIDELRKDVERLSS